MLPAIIFIFDASGKPTNSAKAGTWTTDSQMHVQKISVEKGVLRIEGHRSFFFYDPWTNQMRNIGELAPDDRATVLFRSQAKDLQGWYRSASKVKVSVECGNSQPEMDDVVKCTNHVFLAPNEANEAELARTNTRLAEQRTTPRKSLRRRIPRVPPSPCALEEGVSAPRALHTPDPSYSEIARSAGYQAKAVLWSIVDTDGLPKNIKVERPVGLGLDDQAVKLWRPGGLHLR